MKIEKRSGGTDSYELSNINRIYFSGNSLSNGLAAYYPFDGNANDASGNGNHGTAYGGVTYVPDSAGNPNSACQFNGSNGYILAQNSPSLQLGTGKLSICLWFKCTGDGNSDALGFVGKNDNNADIPQYTLQCNPIGLIHFGVHDSASNSLQWHSATSGFVRHKWYFLCTTWDGDTSKIYINSTLISTQVFKYKMKTDNHSLEIGRGGLNDFYNGIIDELRIYNRALSKSEIDALFIR